MIEIIFLIIKVVIVAATAVACVVFGGIILAKAFEAVTFKDSAQDEHQCTTCYFDGSCREQDLINEHCTDKKITTCKKYEAHMCSYSDEV